MLEWLKTSAYTLIFRHSLANFPVFPGQRGVYGIFHKVVLAAVIHKRLPGFVKAYREIAKKPAKLSGGASIRAT